jgi:hypothetical protein
MESNGVPRRPGIPWTWPESIRAAIDKQGNWLSFSVSNLPEKATSMPAGGRGRSFGRWFEAESAGDKYREKKQGEKNNDLNSEK